jgi:hypothetical protein
MIFLMLAAVALIFALLGFLLNAFYFGGSQKISEELEKLQKAVHHANQGAWDAREETAVARTLVRSLEAQLEKRSSEMHVLEKISRRQEEGITLLQKAVAEIRAALKERERIRAPEQNAAQPIVSVMGAVDRAPESGSDGTQDIPLWKNNLNNILSMLEKLEKGSES